MAIVSFDGHHRLCFISFLQMQKSQITTIIIIVIEIARDMDAKRSELSHNFFEETRDEQNVSISPL